MAKTQKGWRVDDEIAELAAARARDRGMSVGDYIAALVLEDVDGLRQRGLDAARRFLDEHQAVFDEAEDARRAPSGAHAA
jgi:predicted HicB family RNase H-like nuclease